MLRGKHDRVGSHRTAVFIAQRHLALGIGTQIRHRAVVAKFALAHHQTVCVVDGGGHQRRGFVAGVAEHQALVSGADRKRVGVFGVNALSDVVRLLVIAHQHRTPLVVDAVFGVVVADALENVARQADVVDRRVGGDFTGEHHEAGVAERFCSHTAH